MTSRVDARVLLLFLVHLIKNENSKTILNLRDLFKIHIEIEKYGPPKRAVECCNYQVFLHIDTQCFMDPKWVGCGEKHKSPECSRKLTETFENEEKN